MDASSGTGRPRGLRDAAGLLAAWEAGLAAPDVARGSAVLVAAGLVGQGDVWHLPLGEVGTTALRCLREVVGAHLPGAVVCTGCGSTLDVDVDLDLLLAAADPSPSAAPVPVVLTVGPVTLRPPTVQDLVDAAAAEDPRGVLVGRCVWHLDDSPLTVSEVSPADLDVVDEVLEDLVGPGMPTLRTTCPECEEEMVALVDPGSLLWDRVRSAAPAVLGDVARLAGAFGWREEDVLALSTARRRAYLELVDG